MIRLYKEELKRILRTRSVLLFLAAALILSVFMAYVPVTFERYTYEENGQKITIKGREALAIIKNLQRPITGEITPQKAVEGLFSYQRNLEKYGDFYGGDFPVNIRNSEILPYQPLVSKLHEVTADPDSGLALDYMEITEEDALHFYDHCRTHLTDLMRMEQKNNPKAQQIASGMYEKVEMPFYYYPGYGSNMAEYEALYLFMLMLLCILITAPLFSAEYQTGADDILRSTRHGRRRLAYVKILSALVISLVSFALCMTIFIIISNSLFGWECRKTSLQLIFSAVNLLNLNLGELQTLVLFAGLLSLLSCVCFILYVSAASKNTTVATGLTIAFGIAPSILYMMVGENTIFSWLRILLPSGSLGGSNAFLYALIDFQFMKIGTFTAWTPWLMLIIPAVEIPLFLWLTVRTYSRRSM